jgi:hypothetical protein
VTERYLSLLAAQDHEQVGDHGGLALLVQLDDAFFVKALQGQADHADGPFDHPLPRAVTAARRRATLRGLALAASGARAHWFAPTRRAAKGPMPCSAQKISQAV